MNESKGQRKISDRQILALLRQNYSVSEIAGELGVCADAIRKRMKRMGRKTLPYVMQSESEILGIQLNTAQQLSYVNQKALEIIADDKSKTIEKLSAMKRNCCPFSITHAAHLINKHSGAAEGQA